MPSNDLHKWRIVYGVFMSAVLEFFLHLSLNNGPKTQNYSKNIKKYPLESKTTSTQVRQVA